MTYSKLVNNRKRGDRTIRLLLFTVLNEIHKITKSNNIDKKKLSRLLIDLDKKGYNLTPIIENISGPTTPYLKYKIQDLTIFNILNHSSEPIFITDEGMKYISHEIDHLYKDPKFTNFIKITNNLIKTQYI